VRVLLSAYACAPGMGSEPEVGLQALLAALREHEVWVLTQPHMARELVSFFAERAERALVRVIPIGPAAPTPAPGLGALAATHLSHDRWQRNAAREALRLDNEHSFDVVHHVTLAAYWMRTGVAVVPKPLVWGPIGGAVEAPLQLVGELGLRGGAEDLVRTVVRRGMARRPAARRTAREASVVLVQNQATSQRVVALGGDPRVLPNALCAHVDAVPAATPRRRDVAVVGRVVAWKAVPLAVRALSLLPGDVRLRIYGDADGPERRRVQAAARRWQVDDRVELVGKLARAELLERMATSGVLLHPSLHDEASFTVAEARSLGTPVVVLDHGGPPAVASHWPGGEVRLIRPSRPSVTAARLAGGVLELLEPLRPLAGAVSLPDVDFGEQVLSAYREAVTPRPPADVGAAR